MGEKKNYKTFIDSKCKPETGDSLLKGKNGYILPHASPKISSTKIWEAEIYDGAKKIKTNKEFGDALKKWYKNYSDEYGLDVGVLVAQAYQESAFKAWNYSDTGALGLTQFTPSTIQTMIINNGGAVTPKFTKEEIAKIKYNITTDIVLAENRAQLHQNIINNPEIMIKAQARYMKHIALKCNNYTSTALFGYNRGVGLVRKTYLDSVQSAREYGLRLKKKNEKYEEEGVLYVHKIFVLLHHSLGYTHLNMDDTGSIDDLIGVKTKNDNM